MAKKQEKEPEPDDEQFKCPKCGSADIGGMMQPFWVALGPDGAPKGDWQDWSAETELGEERLCYNCEHQW